MLCRARLGEHKKLTQSIIGESGEPDRTRLDEQAKNQKNSRWSPTAPVYMLVLSLHRARMQVASCLVFNFAEVAVFVIFNSRIYAGKPSIFILVKTRRYTLAVLEKGI